MSTYLPRALILRISLPQENIVLGGGGCPSTGAFVYCIQLFFIR